MTAAAGPPRVSVVVTATSDSAQLARCLEPLALQVMAEAGELLLVMNCEADCLGEDTRARLAAKVDRLLFEPRVGKSNALNRGVAESRGEVVAFTDDDALPQPGWLASLCQPLLDEPDSKLVGCGGRVLPCYPDEPPPAWFRALVDRKANNFLGPRHDLGEVDREYVFDPDRWTLPLGACCAYRRAILARSPYAADLGPNRMTGQRGGEDNELAMRLLREGLRLRYCAAAIVHHPVTAQRMTREYVSQGYFVSGVERIRVMRTLGLPLPSRAHIRGNLLVGGMRGLTRRLAGAPDLAHADFKQAYRRGMLAELARP